MKKIKAFRQIWATLLSVALVITSIAVFSVQAENTEITQFPASWTRNDPANPDISYSASTDSMDGYSFKLSRLKEGDASPEIFSEKIAVEPNVKYVMYVGLKRTVHDGNCFPWIRYFDEAGNKIGNGDRLSALNTLKYEENRWFYLGYWFTPPADCVAIEIQFFVGGTKVNDLYVDGVRISEFEDRSKSIPVPNGEFEILTQDCNVNTSVAGTGGTISDSAIVSAGSDATVTITPDAGYYISSIKVDDVETAPDSGKLPHEVNTLTLADISGNKTVVATFAPILKQQLGAGIRLSKDNTSGIRFIADVSNGFLSKLPEDATVKMGFLCTHASHAGDAFDPATTEFSDKSVSDWNDSLTPVTEGDKVFSVAIYNIPENDYDYDIAARAYIEVNETKIYANFNAADNVRSIKRIAKSALADPSAPKYEDWQLELLQAYAADRVEDEDIVDSDGLLSFDNLPTEPAAK